MLAIIRKFLVLFYDTDVRHKCRRRRRPSPVGAGVASGRLSPAAARSGDNDCRCHHHQYRTAAAVGGNADRCSRFADSAISALARPAILPATRKSTHFIPETSWSSPSCAPSDTQSTHAASRLSPRHRAIAAAATEPFGCDGNTRRGRYEDGTAYSGDGSGGNPECWQWSLVREGGR